MTLNLIFSHSDGKNQTTFKVQGNSKEKRLCKVPCRQVIEEIYERKFEELLTGTLKYIQ